MFALEAEIEVKEVLEAAHQESGARDEDQRERHLQDDENARRPGRRRARGIPAASVQRSNEIQSGRPPCRQEAEQQYGREPEGGRKGEDPEIDRSTERQRAVRRRGG